MTKNNLLPRRMPAYNMTRCLKRMQPMPDVPLAYTSAYQRIHRQYYLGAVFALGLLPRANTGHLSQIPGRILKTPGNVVFITYLDGICQILSIIK